jgi:hypothetical protein
MRKHKTKICMTPPSTEKKKNTVIPLAGAMVTEPLPTQILDCLKSNPNPYVDFIFDSELKLSYYGEINNISIGLSVCLSKNVTLPNKNITGDLVVARVDCMDVYDELKYYYGKPAESINISICVYKGEKSTYLQIGDTKFKIY